MRNDLVHHPEEPRPVPATAPAATGAPRATALDRSLMLGVAWTAGMKWLTQIVSWGSTLLVARLLTPGDYGLYGMAMVYMGFVAPIYDLGLSAAIIQRRDLDEDRIARLGGLSLLYALGFSLLSIALAAPIAAFYRQPPVERIVVLLSVAFMITAPQMLPRALLARNLEFRKLAWIDGVAGLTLMTSNLVLALLGFRYWSFVYGGLISAVATTALALAWAPHRVAWPRHFQSIRTLALFGWQVAVSRIGFYVYSNADFAVVGRALGAAALGAYTFGWTLATIPVDRVSSLVARVIPSILSAVQDDTAALRRYTLGLTEGLAFIVLPLSVGMALTAEHFVLLVLGPQWTSAIAPLRLLAFYGGVRSLATIISPLLVATGHARRDLQFTLLAVLVLPPCFYIGSRWGAAGVAAAWIIGFPLVLLPAYRFAFRLLGLRASSYVAALWPAASATAVMAVAVLAAGAAVPQSWPVAMRFGTEVVVGAASYLTVIALFHRARVQTFLALVRAVRGGGSVADAEPAPADDATPSASSVAPA